MEEVKRVVTMEVCPRCGQAVLSCGRFFVDSNFQRFLEALQKNGVTELRIFLREECDDNHREKRNDPWAQEGFYY